MPLDSDTKNRDANVHSAKPDDSNICMQRCIINSEQNSSSITPRESRIPLQRDTMNAESNVSSTTPFEDSTSLHFDAKNTDTNKASAITGCDGTFMKSHASADTDAENLINWEMLPIVRDTKRMRDLPYEKDKYRVTCAAVKSRTPPKHLSKALAESLPMIYNRKNTGHTQGGLGARSLGSTVLEDIDHVDLRNSGLAHFASQSLSKIDEISLV